jgi:hypothetical protein
VRGSHNDRRELDRSHNLLKRKACCLHDQAVKGRLADLGGVALPGSPAEFGKLIADETAKWSKVVSFAGLRPE